MATVLVTGGAKRLGREISIGLAKEGYDVVIHCNQSCDQGEELRFLCEEYKVRAWVVQGDLTGDPVAVFRDAMEVSGGVEVLINNAGDFPADTFYSCTPDILRREQDLHLTAPLILSREFAKSLPEGKEGSIINIIDARITDYDKEHLSYHFAKKNLFSLTRILARELSPRIKVNGIAPGLIMKPDDMDQSQWSSLKHSTLLCRTGSPGDVVDTLLFLQKSAFITGQVIFVDGGRNLNGSFY